MHCARVRRLIGATVFVISFLLFINYLSNWFWLSNSFKKCLVLAYLGKEHDPNFQTGTSLIALVILGDRFFGIFLFDVKKRGGKEVIDRQTCSSRQHWAPLEYSGLAYTLFLYWGAHREAFIYKYGG